MFCKSFGSKIKAFFKKVNDVVVENAAIALRVTTAIKDFIESPMVSVIVLMTKTKVDDEIRARLLPALATAIDALAIIDKCKNEVELDLKLKCFITELRKLAPDLQNAILIKLASLLTAQLDGSKEKQSVYDALVQGTYSLNK